jgi:hypothetical protein
MTSLEASYGAVRGQDRFALPVVARDALYPIPRSFSSQAQKDVGSGIRGGVAGLGAVPPLGFSDPVLA